MKGMLSRTALALGALALSASFASAADPVKLTFAIMSPAGSPNAAYYGQWVAKVNAAGKGIVEIEARDGETIANFGNVLDRVNSDVIQIGWMLPALLGGKFPLSEVVALPFTGGDSVACSAALWKLYQDGLLANEYKDIQPIWFGCSDPTFIHWAKAPKSVDSLDGVKVRVKSKNEGLAVTGLGGTPVSLVSNEQYEALQRGTIDATNTGWAGFPAYKMNEVTNYHLEASFGMAPTLHFMSKAKFNALPKAVQDVLLANGGVPRSKEMGQYMLDTAKGARDQAISLKHTIVQLSPEQAANWKKKTEGVAAAWAKSVPDGEKVLDAYVKAYTAAGGK